MYQKWRSDTATTGISGTNSILIVLLVEVVDLGYGAQDEKCRSHTGSPIPGLSLLVDRLVCQIDDALCADRVPFALFP